MNLIQLLGSFIEGIPKEDLKDIMSGNSEDVHVVSGSNGVIILSNKKIIRCANKYYVKPGEEPIKKFKSKANTCHEVQQKLGVLTNPMNCRACHLSCLRKVDNKELLVYVKLK